MDFDWDVWESAETTRQADSRANRRAAVVQAQREARRLSEKIHQLDPQVTRVKLFGSVARENPSHDHFDIDLAVTGATSMALLEPEILAEGFRVDLVDTEHLPIRLRENIDREGITLYEK